MSKSRKQNVQNKSISAKIMLKLKKTLTCFKNISKLFLERFLGNFSFPVTTFKPRLFRSTKSVEVYKFIMRPLKVCRQCCNGDNSCFGNGELLAASTSASDWDSNYIY